MPSGDDVELEIPLNLAFGNPDLLEVVGLGSVLRGLGAERQYRNDEMIDNQLRSVLFQIPAPDARTRASASTARPCPTASGACSISGPSTSSEGATMACPPTTTCASPTACARSVVPRHHRRADRGLPGRARDIGDEIDDPSSLDFIRLMDTEGGRVRPGSDAADEEVVAVVRRTTLAARLQAIYGSVDRLDAFVGMLAERHIPGSEFGQLQRAMWTRQFQALRDGDRFFYLNDPSLPIIEERFGVTYRHSLAEIIAMNSGVALDELQADVFRVAPE